jgi:hypothetical protein
MAEEMNQETQKQEQMSQPWSEDSLSKEEDETHSQGGLSPNALS